VTFELLRAGGRKELTYLTVTFRNFAKRA